MLIYLALFGLIASAQRALLALIIGLKLLLLVAMPYYFQFSIFYSILYFLTSGVVYFHKEIRFFIKYFTNYLFIFFSFIYFVYISKLIFTNLNVYFSLTKVSLIFYYYFSQFWGLNYLDFVNYPFHDTSCSDLVHDNIINKMDDNDSLDKNGKFKLLGMEFSNPFKHFSMEQAKASHAESQEHTTGSILNTTAAGLRVASGVAMGSSVTAALAKRPLAAAGSALFYGGSWVAAQQLTGAAEIQVQKEKDAREAIARRQGELMSERESFRAKLDSSDFDASEIYKTSKANTSEIVKSSDFGPYAKSSLVPDIKFDPSNLSKPAIYDFNDYNLEILNLELANQNLFVIALLFLMGGLFCFYLALVSSFYLANLSFTDAIISYFEKHVNSKQSLTSTTSRIIIKLFTFFKNSTVTIQATLLFILGIYIVLMIFYIYLRYTMPLPEFSPSSINELIKKK